VTIPAYLGVLFAMAFVPMLLEARRSAANYRALLAAGAIEPADDVFAVMQIAYPASFLAMLVEGWARGVPSRALVLAGAAVFVAAKAIKYWAILTLGRRWTFRVVVPPRSTLVADGPYRFFRHPNYIGVMGELIGYALLAHAPLAGTLAALIFAGILMARIRVEERALGLRSR
jgi:methyltransferase